MQLLELSLSRLEGPSSQPMTLQTTLYDLVAAIGAEVGHEEDERAVALVRQLLNTHEARFTGSFKGFRVICEPAQDRT